MRRLAALLLAAASLAQRPANDEQLARHRNLGKAFYENPTTQNESVAEFRRALALRPDSVREKLNLGLALLRAANNPEGLKYLEEVQRLDPQLPHTWFNLGIHWKKQGDAEKALAQFTQLVQLAPAEPKAHYNLGAAHKLAGDNDQAIPAFVRAAALDPSLAAARFQLFNAYRAAGRAAEAKEALAEFQRLKKLQEGAAIPEDVDWCDYAEIYDPQPEIKEILVNPKFQYRALAQNVTFTHVFDVFGDKRPALIAGQAQQIAVFRQGTLPAAPIKVAGARSAAAADFNNDGFADLCVLTAQGPQLLQNKAGVFTPVKVAWPTGNFTKAVWVDFDHDYDLDLFLFGDRPALLRNEGPNGFANHTAKFPFRNEPVADAFVTRVNPDSRAFDIYAAPGTLYRDKLGGLYEATATPPLTVPPEPVDFNLDGKFDQVDLANGTLRVGLDTATPAPNWIRVALTGVRNPLTSLDAWVEVKAGSLYRRARYTGLPLTFHVGAATTVDVVRITWPNGLIQNETKLLVNRAHAFKEAQRLSGSCPIIWTWDGQGFRYITDVLGVAPLGASDGEGSYFATDHDETITIPGDALQPKNGRYEIRVTEELSEAAYLDRIRLTAIDHPADVALYTNEKWKAPPFPEPRLYGVQRVIAPIKATDHDGVDVRAQLLATDKTYPTGFRRELNGIAETHHLTLDFGTASAAGANLLVLHGWVDWADGSTFLQASQAKRPLMPPSLAVKDDHGRWVTVIEDMGMPAGKPKAIVVDLTGQWLSHRREVRITTSLSVYWDRIFLSTAIPTQHQAIDAKLASAQLRFRGFSPSVIHPERSQPEQFSYANPEPTTLWNPTPGLYTRYGPVEPLLTEADDQLLVMGSGDEIVLSFEALPPPAPGVQRDFLLEVTGWAKDRDANTAAGQRVQPLPFRRMSAYPYPANERHPHPEYEKVWNTRPALVLIRSLKGTSPSSH